MRTRKDVISVKVKELFRCAFEFDPLQETVAHQILMRILALLKQDDLVFICMISFYFDEDQDVISLLCKRFLRKNQMRRVWGKFCRTQ